MRSIAVVAVRIVAATTLLLLAALTSPLSAAELSIHELKQHWKKYDGKRVRVRGQLDACGPMWFCSMCPEEMTAENYNSDMCIPFAFEDQHLSKWDQTADEVDQLMRTAYRFSTITVDANFSALCLYDEKGRPVGDVICTDSPANLDYSRIIEVRGRKTASDGLVEKDAVRQLHLAEPDDTSAMASEFRRIISYGQGDPKFFKVALTPSDLRNVSAGDMGVFEGLGCICLIDTCDGKWPTRFFPL